MDGIVVSDSMLEARKLTSRVTVPKRLRKYFKSLDFFAIYDEDVNDDRSILNIPLLASVLPFAWLAGVDVYVDELDRTFKESMDQLQKVFQKDYPDAPFTTHIIAARARTETIQYNVNFTDLAKQLLDKGLVVQTLECPQCSGRIGWPVSGNTTTCEHCGKEVYAVDMFEKFRGLL